MFSSKQKEELRKIKPHNYRKLVQIELKKQDYEYNLETIYSVYSGRRSNAVIAKAIVKVFKTEDKKKQRVVSSLNKAISS